jgi:hypothetical protein
LALTPSLGFNSGWTGQMKRSDVSLTVNQAGAHLGGAVDRQAVEDEKDLVPTSRTRC